MADELADLVRLIERLHRTPGEGRPIGRRDLEETQLHYCVGWLEGLPCCLESLRDSPEFEAARNAVGVGQGGD